MINDYQMPTVQLIGEDGNAFAVLGKVRNALREAGASEEVVEDYITRATQGDYNHLLAVTMEYVNVE